MQVRAIHRNARMAPRKMRPIARMLRGMSAVAASSQLSVMPGKGPQIMLEVLKSAIANAKNNHDIDETTLKVSAITIDGGLVMKRFQPVSKGMAHPILKRTAHVTIVLDGESSGKKKASKKTDISTISADEYTVQHVHDELKETKEEVPTEPVKNAPSDDRPVETVKDKTEHEAFQKTKMQQLGGDRKKSHRRKSIG